MEIKLSQAIIIQAAFDILAETQALSQLSMRNIANRIHVQAPALYWYFKNKQQLLQKMAETMEEELALPDPTLPWNEQLLQYMENYYDLYTFSLWGRIRNQYCARFSESIRTFGTNDPTTCS